MSDESEAAARRQEAFKKTIIDIMLRHLRGGNMQSVTEIKFAPSRLVTAVETAMRSVYLTDEIDTSSGIYAVEGMSGKRYRLFINSLIAALGDTSYMEVGSYKGSTLCAAIAGNSIRAVAIDDWTMFGGPKDECIANVALFRSPENFPEIIQQEFQTVDYAAMAPIEIYFYDGPHDSIDQYEGIMLALPALTDEFILIIDDWNMEPVRKGTKSAIRQAKLDILMAIEITTMPNACFPLETQTGKDSDWHNGYYIAVMRKPR
jgi:hypothetical protein